MRLTFVDEGDRLRAMTTASLALLFATLAAGEEIAGYECMWGLEPHLKEHDGRIALVLPSGTLRYGGSAMHGCARLEAESR